MELLTSKRKTYDVSWIGGPTQLSGEVFLEMQDDRALSAISREFESLEWMERRSEQQGNERYEGYDTLTMISRQKGSDIVRLSLGRSDQA